MYGRRNVRHRQPYYLILLANLVHQIANMDVKPPVTIVLIAGERAWASCGCAHVRKRVCACVRACMHAIMHAGV